MTQKVSFRSALVGMGFVLASLASQTTCRADFQSQTQFYGPSNTPFSDNLTFNKFDATLGTLNSVTLILTENGTVTSTVINLGAASTYSGVTATGMVSVTGPDSTSVSASFTTASASGSIGAGSFTGATSKNVGSISGSASSTSNITGAGVTSYEGVGTMTYTIAAMGSVTSTGTSTSPLVFFGGSATLSGSLEIDYDYTKNAVPEPASMALLGLGLVGVVGMVRRRKTA